MVDDDDEDEYEHNDDDDKDDLLLRSSSCPDNELGPRPQAQICMKQMVCSYGIMWLWVIYCM